MRTVVILMIMAVLAGCVHQSEDNFSKRVPNPDTTEILYQKEISNGTIYFYKDETGFRHAYIPYSKDGNSLNSGNADLSPSDGISWTMINGGKTVEIVTFAGIVTDTEIAYVLVKQRSKSKFAEIIDVGGGKRLWFAVFDKLETAEPGHPDPLKVEALTREGIIVWKDGVYEKDSATKSWAPVNPALDSFTSKLAAFPGGNFRAGERAGCWWNIYLPYDKIRSKSIEIIAEHKETGTEMYELPYTTVQEVGMDYNINLTRVPTDFNIPLSGLWRFEVYIDNTLWDTVIIDVPGIDETWELEKNSYITKRFKANDGLIETGKGHIRAKGNVTDGSILIRSLEGERGLPAQGYYEGDYEVIYRNSSGNESIVAKLEDLDIYKDTEVMELAKFKYGNYDVVIFQPVNVWFIRSFVSTQNIYVFAVDDRGEAFQLTFNSKKQHYLLESEFLPIAVRNLITKEGPYLLTYSLVPELSELILKPDFIYRTMDIVSVKEPREDYIQAYELAVEFANLIELAVAADWGEAKLLHDEDQSELPNPRDFFTVKAWNSDVMQYVIEHSAKDTGTFSLPFRWEPIDFTFVDDNTFHFTYTMNILYAIGQALHMDIELTKHNGKWIISEVDNLKIEGME